MSDDRRDKSEHRRGGPGKRSTRTFPGSRDAERPSSKSPFTARIPDGAPLYDDSDEDSVLGAPWTITAGVVVDDPDDDEEGSYIDEDDITGDEALRGPELERGIEPLEEPGESARPTKAFDHGAGSTRYEALISNPRTARMVGAVLGASIGDAMGNPTEFLGSFEAIHERYGPEGVTGFVLYRDGPTGRFAPFTDDTQMAEVVLRSLLWCREQDADLDATMSYMAKGFVEWAKFPKGGHRAPGNACLAGCRALERGVHWSKAGGAQAGGCGSVMRAYPFGLFFSSDLERAERWSVAHSKLTHGDPIALAASAAMAVGVGRIVRDEPVDLVLSEMVAAACRYSVKTARMMCEAWEEAQRGVEPSVTLQRLQGWAAHEAIAAAVYLFARHHDSPRAAILEAANTPGDSDSLATLAGAMTGARCGLAALPEEWVRDVERSHEFIKLATRIS